MIIQQVLATVLVIILVLLAISIKPLRKTMGLLLILLGFLAGMTVIGLVFGIPMIIIGGILLFI